MGGPVSKDRIELYIEGREKSSKPYHLKAVGLPNVYLLNGVSFEKDEEYGDVAHIENIKGLHVAIGLYIVEKPGLMTGKEFRFLRKQMGLTQEGLGQKLQLSAQTIANYEKQTTNSTGPADAFLRIAYLLHILPEDARTKLIKQMMENLGARSRRSRLPDMPRHRLVEGWHDRGLSACAAY
jgi:transcriptional regulator with XRE-family HTH domain